MPDGMDETVVCELTAGLAEGAGLHVDYAARVKMVDN